MSRHREKVDLAARFIAAGNRVEAARHLKAALVYIDQEEAPDLALRGKVESLLSVVEQIAGAA